MHLFHYTLMGVCTMYEQFFRNVLKGNFGIIWVTVFMYDDKQLCWNPFSHISSVSDAANMFFAFAPMSRDFKDFKYFLSLTSIKKSSVADTFVMFLFWRLYKYFDLINLLLVFHSFSISVYNMYTNGRIVWNFFKSISKSVAKYSANERYRSVPSSLKFFWFVHILEFFLTSRKPAVFGEKN